MVRGLSTFLKKFGHIPDHDGMRVKKYGHIPDHDGMRVKKYGHIPDNNGMRVKKYGHTRAYQHEGEEIWTQQSLSA